MPLLTEVVTVAVTAFLSVLVIVGVCLAVAIRIEERADRRRAAMYQALYLARRAQSLPPPTGPAPVTRAPSATSVARHGVGQERCPACDRPVVEGSTARTLHHLDPAGQVCPGGGLAYVSFEIGEDPV